MEGEEEEEEDEEEEEKEEEEEDIISFWTRTRRLHEQIRRLDLRFYCSLYLLVLDFSPRKAVSSDLRKNDLICVRKFYSRP